VPIINDFVRSKQGAPIASDFAFDVGSPIVIDQTAATGQMYFMDSAGTIRNVACPVDTTFTPGLTFGGGSTGMAFTTQLGAASLIGNLVFASGQIVLSAKGSSTGAARLTGLPYSYGATAHFYAPPTLYFVNITYGGVFQGLPVLGSNAIDLNQVSAAGTASNLNDTNFSNTSQIAFMAVYRRA